MSGENRRVESIERLYIRKKLIESRIDFPWTGTIWIERVGQSVEREDETSIFTAPSPTGFRPSHCSTWDEMVHAPDEGSTVPH